jgi:hypothetical protein
MSEIARKPGAYVWEGKIVTRHGLVHKAMVWEYPDGEREIEVKDESHWDHGYYPLPGGEFEVQEYRPPLSGKVK